MGNQIAENIQVHSTKSVTWSSSLNNSALLNTSAIENYQRDENKENFKCEKSSVEEVDPVLSLKNSFFQPDELVAQAKKIKLEKSKNSHLPAVGTSNKWVEIHKKKEQERSDKKNKIAQKEDLQKQKKDLADEKKEIDERIKKLQAQIKMINTEKQLPLPKPDNIDEARLCPMQYLSKKKQKTLNKSTKRERMPAVGTAEDWIKIHESRKAHKENIEALDKEKADLMLQKKDLIDNKKEIDSKMKKLQQRIKNLK